MLSPYRVLDLTDDRAALGPQILADLGAEVITIEPPGGSPARRGRGLRFAAFNRNKRSVTLDLDAAAGRAAFLDLVASADFLFENAEPGAMAAHGRGFDALREVNPRLIYVAISPFGQDGPYRGLLASDLTLSALSGQMAMYGDADRPPVPPGLAGQFDAVDEFFGAFGFEIARTDELEADDLLGTYAAAEAAGGGRALLLTADRDMFQCASEAVSVLYVKTGSGATGPAAGAAPKGVPEIARAVRQRKVLGRLINTSGQDPVGRRSTPRD